MTEKLLRLKRLIGTDEGFYVLALHAFIEWYLRSEKGYGDELRFPELTWKLREELLGQQENTFIEGLNCLGRLGKQHTITNQVRHAFEVLDAEEALGATHLFLSFCSLIGIGSNPEVKSLSAALSGWKNRTSVIEQQAVLKHMQQELIHLQDQNQSLLRQKSSYDKAKQELDELKLDIARYDIELQREKSRNTKKDKKIDELRKERHALTEERKRIENRFSDYNDLQKYLRYLSRFSLYTQTRMDYERYIGKLTPEQEEVTNSISLKKDFLVRGGAGTGKSLVLIEALRRTIRQGELDLEPGESVTFVTFTRTLAKYNQYLSELAGLKIPLEVISTVDSLVYRILKALNPESEFDFDIIDHFLKSDNTPPFLSRNNLISEIENYLFGTNIPREDYVDKMIPRPGMPGTLDRNQRAEIFSLRDDLIRFMEKENSYSRNYARLKLIDHFSRNKEELKHHSTGLLFVDEVQDLTAADLQFLKMITRRSLIMAGDSDQSLYTCRLPFARAGINITGTTRILKTNFRNTCQIHRLSESFRKSAPKGTWNTANEPFAFREGPIPELYKSQEVKELLFLLTEKTILFIKDMEYEPENLVILVPRNREIAAVQHALEAREVESENLAAPEFSFSGSSKVRISTLHSAKGLDFPVVLMYLPYLPRKELFDHYETESLMRRLVYVGMTRAMDNLNVFLRPQNDPVLQELDECFSRFNGPQQ
ncbi:MAG: UvrD-helicase domain-containing protein [Spirochaetia bacterium]